MVRKGKKDAKEKEKKSKKARQKPTVKEAILTYQINIREKCLDEVLFESKILKDDNDKKKAFNDSIKKDQERLVRELIVSTKGIVSEKLDKSFVGRESVVEALQLNWQITNSYEADLVKLNEEIRGVEEKIEEEKKHLEYWREYEENGQLLAQKKIELLQQEQRDRETTFQIMTGEMVKKLTKAKQTIEEITGETLAQQKSAAIKKAVSKMERFTRQDIVDNMWLHKELEKCRGETQELLRTIGKQEVENLELLSALFKCKTEDLQLSRQNFAEKLSSEDLALSNLMEIDLSKLSFHAQ